jgi:hypothetical protein
MPRTVPPENPGKRGIWIRHEVLQHPELTWLSKTVYGLLDSSPSFRRKGVLVTDEQMAGALNVGLRTIKTSVHQLRQYGLIETSRDREKRRVLRGASIGPKTALCKTAGIKKETFKGGEGGILSDAPSSACKAPKEHEFFAKKRSRRAPDQLVEFWNRIIGPHPRHRSPDTGVYKNSSTILRRIKSGRFLDHYGPDRDWCEHHKITDRLMTTQLSRQEVQRGLVLLSKLYLPEFWPNNKSTLPRELHSLLYNPRTGRSMFYFVMARGLFKAGASGDRREDLTPEGQLILSTLKEINSNGIGPTPNLKAQQAVKRISDWRKAHPSTESEFTLKRLVEHFCDWLLDQHKSGIRRTVTLASFGPGSASWDWFVDAEERKLGFTLR